MVNNTDKKEMTWRWGKRHERGVSRTIGFYSLFESWSWRFWPSSDASTRTKRTCFNIESSQMGADRSITLVGFFVSGIYTPLYTSHEIPRLRENTRMNKKRETALLLTLVAVGRATLRSAVSLPNNPPSALRRAAPGCWRTTPCGWAGYPICCHSRCLCGEEVANENQEKKKQRWRQNQLLVTEATFRVSSTFDGKHLINGPLPPRLTRFAFVPGN